jgi:hypothetical protein
MGFDGGGTLTLRSLGSEDFGLQEFNLNSDGNEQATVI